MAPRYPVFVPSKGRWQTRYTMKALDRIGVAYSVVVEPQEAKNYRAVLSPNARVLVTPHRNLGLVATRNWIWDHAQSLGVDRFWTFDDNIKAFYRFNRNLKTPVGCGSCMAAIEDFADRYENLVIAGMQYFMFAPRKSQQPPVLFNTRVYSNMLIETGACDLIGRPYRNEGFYNDDTDLCLRVLKDGRCTALFNTFLVEKSITMTVAGGMTPHYQGDGRYRMAKELADKHPDVARISVKWGRYQHHVDYSGFRRNLLRLRPGVKIPEGVDDYGMKLVKLDRPVAEE